MASPTGNISSALTTQANSPWYVDPNTNTLVPSSEITFDPSGIATNIGNYSGMGALNSSNAAYWAQAEQVGQSAAASVANNPIVNNIKGYSMPITSGEMGQLQTDATQTVADLNSGNYLGAWQTAESLDSDPLYAVNAATNSGQSTDSLGGAQANGGSSNPLLNSLTSSSGLESLDPSKQWNSAATQGFYQAFSNPSVYNPALLGNNPSGRWAPSSTLSADATKNAAAGGAPNVEGYAGMSPGQGTFLDKYGTSILGLAASAIMGPGMVSGIAGDLAGGATVTTADTAGAGAIYGGITGTQSSIGNGTNPLVGGLEGAVSGGISNGGAQLLGGALADSTGLPAGVATGIAKAGLGAGTSALGAALNGGNVGNAALIGGVKSGLGSLVSGGLSAAGIGTTGIDNAVGSGVGSLGSNLLGTALSGGGANSSGAAPQTSSIGNIGNMAATSSTDSSLASTITGALPGLVSGAASIYGTQNAAEAVTNADTNAINTQNTALGNINNVWSTQQGLGQGADTALGSALGTNGQPANYSGFENMPGYQFAVNQGTQAIQRQAASMGSAYTPNTAAAVGQYVTGTAASDYNTYISQLMGAAGLGSTANTGLQTANQTNANNVSTLQQNQGYAQASGVQGASNTVAGLFGATGAGTGLLNGVLGGSSNANSSGVPQGNGTASSNAADPFAGTDLANNQNAIDVYNLTNGPTSSNISNLTGASTAGQGVNAPIQPFDTSSIDTPSYLDLSGY